MFLVSAPTGDLIPAKLTEQSDGDYQLEYATKFTGGKAVLILSLCPSSSSSSSFYHFR